MGESTCTMAKFNERCHAVNTVRVTFSIYSQHLTVENILYTIAAETSRGWGIWSDIGFNKPKLSPPNPCI